MEFFIERFTNFFDNRFISTFNVDSAEGLQPGIYLVGTYYADKGITGNSNFEVRYFVVNAAGKRFPSTGYETYAPTLSAGENEFTITEALTGEDRTKDVTIYLFDTFTITTTTDQFSYLLDQPILAEVSGGAWSQALPAATADEGRDLENQWGQTNFEGLNEVTYWLRDPNADIFYSDNTINFTWAPEVPIVDLDGSANVRDEFTATSTDISLKYLLGGVVQRTPEGVALYTPEGALLTYGGTEVSEPFVQLTPGDNTLVVGNISDDFGNIGSTTLCPNVVLPPIIRYDGVTTLVEVDMAENPENPLEVYYDAPFTVYAGTAYEISSQVYRWLFTKGTYGTIPKTISFTDSTTGRTTTTAPIDIEFSESGFTILDDYSQFFMINDFGSNEIFDDVGEFYMINGGI